MLELKEIKENAIQAGQVYLNHEVIITDPCYTEDTWCLEKYNLPLQGMYDCYYTKDKEYGRIASIWVVLTGISEVVKGEEIGTCGVDSGQLGIFNLDKYRKAITKEEFIKTTKSNFPYEDWKRTWDEEDEDEEKFYKACCNLTLASDNEGILEGVGFVSSSGFGDGSYPLYELKDKDGTVVGLRADFIGEYEDEEF